MGGGVAVLTLINPHFLISRMIKFEAYNVSMYVEALRLLSITRIETSLIGILLPASTWKRSFLIVRRVPRVASVTEY